MYIRIQGGVNRGGGDRRVRGTYLGLVRLNGDLSIAKRGLRNFIPILTILGPHLSNNPLKQRSVSRKCHGDRCREHHQHCVQNTQGHPPMLYVVVYL